MKKEYIILILILIASILAVLLFGLSNLKFSVLNIMTDWTCIRSGTTITCSATQNRYGPCGFSYQKQYLNFCYQAAIGDLPAFIMDKLGESGTLTDSQKQEVYDNLRLSGDCKLGFYIGTFEGNMGDPSYPSNACVYSYYFIHTQKYSELKCSNKRFDTCDVTYLNNRCQSNGIYREPIRIFFGNKNSFGTCSFTTKIAKPSVTPTGTLSITFIGLLSGLSILSAIALILLIPK